MEKIDSFLKDHTTLMPGFYLSSQKHGISTFDLRMKRPNAGDFLSNPALHAIEHILATLLRNGAFAQNIVYFGPMGCRTGFYLLTVEMSEEEAKKYLLECLRAALFINQIPGCSEMECGNYLEHDLDGAKREIQSYLNLLEEEK